MWINLTQNGFQNWTKYLLYQKYFYIDKVKQLKQKLQQKILNGTYLNNFNKLIYSTIKSKRF